MWVHCAPAATEFSTRQYDSLSFLLFERFKVKGKSSFSAVSQHAKYWLGNKEALKENFSKRSMNEAYLCARKVRLWSECLCSCIFTCWNLIAHVMVGRRASGRWFGLEGRALLVEINFLMRETPPPHPPASSFCSSQRRGSQGWLSRKWALRTHRVYWCPDLWLPRLYKSEK